MSNELGDQRRRIGAAQIEHAMPATKVRARSQPEIASVPLERASRNGHSPKLPQAMLQREIALFQSRATQAQAELEVALEREARSAKRIRDLEAALAEQARADDTVLLSTRLQQAERELEVYKTAKRSAELNVLDIRSVWKEAEARLEKTRTSPAYGLGNLIMAGLSSWSGRVRLPYQLLKWYGAYRRAGDRQPELVPAGAAPEYLHASQAAAARAQKEGPEAAARWVQDQHLRAPILAKVLLDLAKEARRTGSGDAAALARSAVEADPNEARAKHLAFMLMDTGSIRESCRILQAAISAGASLNETEERRYRELLAWQRLQVQGIRLPNLRKRVHADGIRILIYVPQSQPFHWSAVSMRAHALAQTLREAGCTVDVVTPPGYPARSADDPRRKDGPDIVEGIRYHRMRANQASAGIVDEYAGEVGLALARTARALDATAIVAASDLVSAYPAAIAARISGAALIVDCQKLPDAWAQPDSGERKDLLQKLEFALMNEAGLVLARWPGASDILQESAIPSSKITVLGDTPPTFPVDTKSPDWQTDPAVLGRVVIGYVGDPSEDIDLEAIGDIFDRLVNRGLDPALAVFGVGSRFQKLRERLVQLGHGSRILFPGRPRTGSLAAAYNAIDIIVTPTRPHGNLPARSRFELIEALAHGKAVVASGEPVAREILDQCAEIVEGGSEEMTEALARLIGDPVRRATLSEAAATRARQFLKSSSVERIMDKIRTTRSDLQP
ncbi:hypothetical protein LMIY3S_00333 [Labrys miyagiensis]